MPIYALEDFHPVVKANSYIHPSAEIIGDVIIEEHCFIGPGAVLRGDFGRIFVGHHSNVQDTCVLHSFPDKDCHLEPFSHIGHGAVLHGCRVGRHSLVGMNAVVMDDAMIGAESFVAASSFVRAGFQCEPRAMLMGVPAKVVRQVRDEEFGWKETGTREYVELAERYTSSVREVLPLTETQKNRPRYQDSTHKPK